MGFENIRLDWEEHLAVLTMNRPSALNALNSQTLTELEEAIDQVAEAEEVRVLVITGEGKAFIAGADIGEMIDLDEEGALAFAKAGQRVLSKLEALPKVVIAAVNGFALGGGCELSMACDLIYASERAKFGQPEVNLGVIPGFGGTQRLTRLLGPMLARDLILTGRMIDADEAFAYGLVAAVLPTTELIDHVRKLAKTIAQKGPIAVAYAKRVILEGPDLTFEEAQTAEAVAFARCFRSDDQSEGMNAFLNKRRAKFTGR